MDVVLVDFVSRGNKNLWSKSWSKSHYCSMILKDALQAIHVLANTVHYFCCFVMSSWNHSSSCLTLRHMHLRKGGHRSRETKQPETEVKVISMTTLSVVRELEFLCSSRYDNSVHTSWRIFFSQVSPCLSSSAPRASEQPQVHGRASSNELRDRGRCDLPAPHLR